MVDYREILRRHSLGDSIRAIALGVNSSRDTVSATLRAAKVAGVESPLDEDVSNGVLQDILFPGKYAYASPFTVPDFARIHEALAKKGVTLTLLHTEYSAAVLANGGIPYQYTQFCEKYRRWARATKATMRITHKPGDAMQVDWAGDPLYITDSVTGEQWPAYIFVAVLPCNWYTYAEACSDMKQENWLLCHVHAYEYFGGATRLLIPDNCKTATTVNNKYEIVLNRSYNELAEHYGTAIVPARVRKPDDKAAVEGTVRHVSTWITAALRDRKFFSLEEARRAVIEKLEELNSRPFQKKPGNRAKAFEEEEKAWMLPLPAVPFEPSTWFHPKVSYDYLISDGKNKYSVPYDLIGEHVDVRLTCNLVEVFFQGARVALHVRLVAAQREPVVKPEHMPEAHRRFLSYNEHDFTEWAASVGPNTLKIVRYFMQKGRAVEQGFKPCASLQRYAKQYGNERLEDVLPPNRLVFIGLSVFLKTDSCETIATLPWAPIVAIKAWLAITARISSSDIFVSSVFLRGISCAGDIALCSASRATHAVRRIAPISTGTALRRLIHAGRRILSLLVNAPLWRTALSKATHCHARRKHQ